MAANAVPGADAGPTGVTPPAENGSLPAGAAAESAGTPRSAGDEERPPGDAGGVITAGAAAGLGDPISGDRVPPDTVDLPTRRRLSWRWAARGVALLAVAVTVMLSALAIGMRSNDNAIDEHFGSATATVLSVTPLRTGIEFVDITGSTIRPEAGVLYPGLLSVGQQFVVEYSTQDPQIARVAGRTASVGSVMIAAVLAGTYLVAVPVVWFCLRRARLPLLGLRRGGHIAPSPDARRR